MISIVVTPPSPITNVLYRTLSRCCEVMCVTREKILLPDPVDHAPDILLIDSPTPPECGGKVIYVLEGAPPECEFTPGTHAAAVIHSENMRALSFAAKHHLKTLTCGLSVHDTLTLSSLTEESAMVCLQREIVTVNGGMLEPGEFPIRIRASVGRGELLIVAGVLLLCGDGDRDINV